MIGREREKRKLSSAQEAGPGKPSLSELDYYAGVDLGQKRDPSVVAVVLKEDVHYSLVHLHVFPLHTEYVDVLGYLKRVAERFRTVRRWTIDETGVGVPFIELARKIGLNNVKGEVLTLPKKQEIMTNMKQVMEQERLSFRSNRELENEIGGVIAELTASGKTKFSHRSGTHGDRLWAVALALYGGRYDAPHYKSAIAFGHVVKPWWKYPPPRGLKGHGLTFYGDSGLPIPWPPGRSQVGY